MEKNNLVKCCRCRNKHLENDRIWKKAQRHGVSCQDSVCPRCECTTYYLIKDEKESIQ